MAHGHKDTNDDSKQANEKSSKLVRSVDLPITGNPYPPRDVVQDDAPGMLELKVRTVRTTLQPYLSPIYSAYEKTHDIISIGVAHSQSTMQRLAENQSSILNAFVISGAGLLGVALARRRSIFHKLLYGSVFFGGAMAACYPKDAEEKLQLMWYVAQNKLPELAKQQYGKLTGKEETEQNKPEKSE